MTNGVASAALRSIAMRVGAIVVPAIGGLLSAARAELVCVVGVALFAFSLASYEVVADVVP